MKKPLIAVPIGSGRSWTGDRSKICCIRDVFEAADCVIVGDKTII